MEVTSKGGEEATQVILSFFEKGKDRNVGWSDHFTDREIPWGAAGSQRQA